MAHGTRKTLFTPRYDDIHLEGEIFCGGSPGVVLCHPHPLYGGSMDSIVVTALFDALSGAGCSVLRFNFRGVGRSAGSHSGGEGEVRDALGALDHLKAQCGCETTVLAGYSFGSAVALRALRDSGAARFIAVALLTETGREIYGGTPIEVTVPSLVAAGELDNFSRIENIGQVASFADPPVELLLPGCDHFFSKLESVSILCDNAVRFLTGN